MKLNKYFYLLASLFVFVSCSKEHNDDALSDPELLNLELRPISIEMEAYGEESEELIENKTRSWNYDITNKGTALNLNAKDLSNKDSVDIPSVVILAKGSKKYIFNITWSKRKGQNYLKVKEEDIPITDLRGQKISLSAGDWFLAAILDRSINSTTAGDSKYNISFDPNDFTTSNNKIVPFAEGDKIIRDVPIYLPWSKVKVINEGAKFMIYGTKKHKNPLTFKSFGNMLRIKLTNEAAYPTRVKGLSLESNVLRTSAGAFNLLSTTSPKAGAMPFNWVPEQNTDQQTFNIDPFNLDESGGVLKKNGKPTSYVLWFAPITNANPRTHIIANVKRRFNGIEQNLPTMNRLYVWGSTGQPTSSKKFVADATINREKQILEYFSFVNRIERSTNIGFTKEEAKIELSKRKYKDKNLKYPHVKELEALGPRIKNKKLLNFRGTGDVTATNLVYRVNGQNGTYTDIFRNGHIMYALRSDAEGRRYYAAWRYNPNNDKPRFIVQSVYLGKHYKGNINDIATEEFWTTHRDDIIEKRFKKGFLYSQKKREFRNSYVASSADGLDEYTVYSIGNSLQNNPFSGFKENEEFNIMEATILPLEKPGTPWKNN